MKTTADSLHKYLPLRILYAINALPGDILCSVNEIRLRAGRPLSLTVGRKNLFLDEKGNICNIQSALRATGREIQECVYRLTDGSRYTRDEQIAQGFIALPDGGRAGICGRADEKGGYLEIDGINLRIHRFFPNIARRLTEYLSSFGLCGVLVCSPPAMGKTSYLRSTAYLLGTGKGIAPARVGIADERCELAAGLPQDGIIDVISAIPKHKAITMLIRTMSPQVIICDEISADEADSVIEAQSTGVSLIASAHCSTPSELLMRGRLKSLIENGLFPLCVLLGRNGDYEAEIYKTEELL